MLEMENVNEFIFLSCMASEDCRRIHEIKSSLAMAKVFLILEKKLQIKYTLIWPHKHKWIV